MRNTTSNNYDNDYNYNSYTINRWTGIINSWYSDNNSVVQYLNHILTNGNGGVELSKDTPFFTDTVEKYKKLIEYKNDYFPLTYKKVNGIGKSFYKVYAVDISYFLCLVNWKNKDGDTIIIDKEDLEFDPSEHIRKLTPILYFKEEEEWLAFKDIFEQDIEDFRELLGKLCGDILVEST